MAVAVERDRAHLVGEVGRHRVHRVGQRAPGPGNAAHVRLATELALGAHLAGHPGDLVGERGQLVDHRVHGAADPVELTAQRAALDLQRHVLGEVALGDGRDHARDLRGRPGQVVDQRVDRRRAGRPRAVRGLLVQALEHPALPADDPADPQQVPVASLLQADQLVEAVDHLAGQAAAPGQPDVEPSRGGRRSSRPPARSAGRRRPRFASGGRCVRAPPWSPDRLAAVMCPVFIWMSLERVTRDSMSKSRLQHVRRNRQTAAVDASLARRVRLPADRRRPMRGPPHAAGRAARGRAGRPGRRRPAADQRAVRERGAARRHRLRAVDRCRRPRADRDGHRPRPDPDGDRTAPGRGPATTGSRHPRPGPGAGRRDRPRPGAPGTTPRGHQVWFTLRLSSPDEPATGPSARTAAEPTARRRRSWPMAVPAPDRLARAGAGRWLLHLPATTSSA